MSYVFTPSWIEFVSNKIGEINTPSLKRLKHLFKNLQETFLDTLIHSSYRKKVSYLCMK